MSKQAYLLWVLTVGFLLSLTNSLALPTNAQVVSEVFDHSKLVAVNRYEDAVAREIRHAETPFKRVAQSRPVRLVSYSDSSVSTLDAAINQRQYSAHPFRLAPTFGTLIYDGAWGELVSNSYSAGVIYSRDLTEGIALEMEGQFSKNTMTHPGGHSHGFSQIGTSASLRLNLLDHSRFTPYMSAGLGSVFFSGLSHGPDQFNDGQLKDGESNNAQYNDWVLGGQLGFGVEYDVTQRIRLGVRTTYTAPAFRTISGNGIALNPNDDAGLVGVGFVRAMALVSVRL